MTDAKVIRFDATGGPDVLRLETVEVGDPGAGEIKIRQTAIGVNFVDTYHRTGLYPLPLPSGIGLEAAGVVEAIGPEVLDFAVGDRVGYCWGPVGAYATERLMPASRVIALPGLVTNEIAAAALLKGCTTEMLVDRCAKVEAGQTVLVHAAAGGVGQLLVQWLRHVGARVIGTAGTAEKAAIAREAGADDVILYRDDDVPSAVRELTDGKGVDVVFDGVGRDTWAGSLASLAKRGLLVSYGNASGPVEGVNIGVLARSGSLFVTRPTMMDYYLTRDEILTGAGRLLNLIADGTIVVDIGATFPLTDAAEAHRAMEGRATMRSTILIP
ncbi:quinone oxidoreductase [Polymorphobacter sp. PAMC 29334]|uniref:quinone oxidoreductase family protein n=1 Tax=Polymorphobacter sp. PAMC 29334 TaxID=2862331 RepID=UPI001C66DBD5|nr:quinone oxidoreductase [Polymorphobacter sp. PAMC 29334]QYE35719.1 quinone oxidoreductase [Polymorphobacter sp. PAMC 29334]